MEIKCKECNINEATHLAYFSTISRDNNKDVIMTAAFYCRGCLKKSTVVLPEVDVIILSFMQLGSMTNDQIGDLVSKRKRRSEFNYMAAKAMRDKIWYIWNTYSKAKTEA
jgi:hypothetical protein